VPAGRNNIAPAAAIAKAPDSTALPTVFMTASSSPKIAATDGRPGPSDLVRLRALSPNLGAHHK
jgi:hypothetical protein